MGSRESLSSEEAQADNGSAEASSEGFNPHCESGASELAGGHSDLDFGATPSGEKVPRRLKHITQQDKWDRLQQFYSDSYRQLFKDEIDPATQSEDEAYEDSFDSSQLGYVSWTSAEKEALFNALSLKGRCDLSALSASVGSKSIVEVQAYLRLVQEKMSEKHLSNPSDASILLAEIPAAFEISAETVRMLEKAADALCVYQEQYENAAGMKVHGDQWLIDRENAKRCENERGSTPESPIENGSDAFPARAFFQLPTFFELSENVFMNRSTPNPDDNWRKLVVSDQRPAATYECLSDLHTIVVSLTRRLVQTSLFVSQTRLRACRYEMYRRANLVKHQDVVAAIDVLKMKRDSFAYWQKAPRRCGLQVVKIRHGRGFNKRPMEYEDIEEALGKRSKKRRGRRQSSGTSEDYTSAEETSYETSANDSDDGDSTKSSEPHSDGSSSQISDNDLGYDSASSDSTDNNEPSPSIPLHLNSSIQIELEDSEAEKQQHADADRLDLTVSRTEDARLVRLLLNDSDSGSPASASLSPRHSPSPSPARAQSQSIYPPMVPTSLRELHSMNAMKQKDWKDTFLPRNEWEDHREPLSEEMFQRTEEGRKRRRNGRRGEGTKGRKTRGR